MIPSVWRRSSSNVLLLLLWLTAGDQVCGTNGQCGVKRSWTQYGKERHEWPWMASIEVDGGHSCGATLISSRWFLTAAHCIRAYQGLRYHNYKARDLTLVMTDSQRKYTVAAIEIFSGYNMWNKNVKSDIAMLRVRGEVTGATPACLPTSGTNFVNRNAWAVGKGAIGNGVYPNAVNEILLRVDSAITCRRHDLTMPSGVLCAGSTNKGTVCDGDSGGPLTVESNGRHILIGVTSYNLHGVCDARSVGYPSYFTDVSFYRGWIDGVMQKYENSNPDLPKSAPTRPTYIPRFSTERPFIFRPSWDDWGLGSRTNDIFSGNQNPHKGQQPRFGSDYDGRDIFTCCSYFLASIHPGRDNPVPLKM